MPGKCSFQIRWLRYADYMDWLLPVPTDKHSARCIFCGIDLRLQSMGESVLRQHKGSARHTKSAVRFKSNTRCQITDFVIPAGHKSAATSCETQFCDKSDLHTEEASKKVIPLIPAASNATFPSQRTGFNIDNETLKAEILWVLKVADAHYSFSSSDNSSKLFHTMFPDSEIARRFACAETKCRYLTTFGLAPRFADLLQADIRSSEAGYVLLFDVSLNKKNQLKQMDFMIRMWQGSEVETRYLTSEFLGHATADDLVSKFEVIFANFHLNKSGLLQLEMDGPNVNWCTYNLINTDMKNNYNITLLHAGSCGLHTIHNAFRRGCEATGWSIEHFLTSAYRLFNDSPARLEDYFSTTGATSLPLKFCHHRWLENVQPVNRALELLPALELFVKAALQKKITLPQNASFQVVKQGVTSTPLLQCQLSFFTSVAEHLEPFLTKYQADKPLLPSLGTDLHALIKGLMQRFLKPEVIVGCSSSQKLMQVDVANTSNHLDLNKIELGFKTSSLLNKAKKHAFVSERLVKEFQKECKDFLLEIIKKLIEKCPLKFAVVRNMQCLDPLLMTDKESSKKKMKNLLQCVIDSGRISDEKGDIILQEYTQFLATTAVMCSASSFDKTTDRFDKWWFDAIGQNSTEYVNLWLLVKKLLLLSHGQATVERGFSFNKEVTADNLSQETLRARRLVLDHIRNVGGIFEVNINKQMLLSASSAWKRYDRFLTDQRKSAQTAEKQMKRKILDDEVQSLKKKRKTAEDDARQLIIEADRLSLKAQEQRSFTLLERANTLRLSSKDKQDEVQKLTCKLSKKEEEQKKFFKINNTCSN